MFNLTIPTGNTTASISIDIIDNIIDGDHETFNVAITLLPSCLSLSLGLSQTTIKILDNESMLTPYIFVYCMIIIHYVVVKNINTVKLIVAYGNKLMYVSKYSNSNADMLYPRKIMPTEIVL